MKWTLSIEESENCSRRHVLATVKHLVVQLSRALVARSPVRRPDVKEIRGLVAEKVGLRRLARSSVMLWDQHFKRLELVLLSLYSKLQDSRNIALRVENNCPINLLHAPPRRRYFARQICLLRQPFIERSQFLKNHETTFSREEATSMIPCRITALKKSGSGESGLEKSRS